MILRNEARILMAARVREQSGFELSRRARMGSGTLYPALVQLERDGLLESRWGEIPDGGTRPPRIYRITIEGVGELHVWLFEDMKRMNRLGNTFWGRVRLLLEDKFWPVPISEETPNA